MIELSAEFLVRKADELLYEQQNFTEAIQLYRAAAILYRNGNQLNLATATLTKMASSLQDNNGFYQEAVDAYREVARIYQQEGNQESYATSLMSAAMVAKKAEYSAMTISLFQEAAIQYESMANSHWQQKQYDYAWDEIQLANRCWKNALETSEVLRENPESFSN